MQRKETLWIPDTRISQWPFSAREAGTYKTDREERQGRRQRMKERNRLSGAERKILKHRLLVRYNLSSKASLKK